MNFLDNAFKSLQRLNEETFDLSAAETPTELQDFLDDSEDIDTLTIIDDEAETEEDIQDSYMGKVILDCNVCHSLLYKDPEEVSLEGEDANVEEECPYCYSQSGFKVIGQVKPFGEEEEEESEEGSEEEEEPAEEEASEESEEEEEKDEKKEESFRPRKRLKRMVESHNKKPVKEFLDFGCVNAQGQTIGLGFGGGTGISQGGATPAAVPGMGEDLQEEYEEHEVTIGFCGFVGVEESYTVYGDTKSEAVNNALEEAAEDLTVENIEDLGDGEYKVMVGWNTFVGVEESYTVYADSEEEAEEEALREAADDLEVIELDGEDFDWDDLDESLKEAKQGADKCPACGKDPCECECESCEDKGEKDLTELFGKKKSKYPDNSQMTRFVEDGEIEAQRLRPGMLVVINGQKAVVDKVKSDSSSKQIMIYDKKGNGKKLSWYDKVKIGQLNVSESIEEGFNKVDIETDDSHLTMDSDEGGKVTITTEPKQEDTFGDDEFSSDEFSAEEVSDETIGAVDDETQQEIEADSEESEDEFGSEEEESDGEEKDDEEIEFDEESFDELGESYLKKVYGNVDSYKTQSVMGDASKLMIEGVIKFTSGAAKKTTFIFESKKQSKGKTLYEGYNKEITRSNRTFKMTCSIPSNKIVCEKLNYRYRANKTLVEGVVGR